MLQTYERYLNMNQTQYFLKTDVLERKKKIGKNKRRNS